MPIENVGPGSVSRSGGIRTTEDIRPAQTSFPKEENENPVAYYATDANSNVVGLMGPGGSLLTDTYIGDASTPEQNATLINAQLSSRGYCEIGPGVHQISTPILMPSNSALSGRGRGITTIKLADGADCCAIQNSNVVAVDTKPAAGQENIHIRDLTIDGNKANQSGLAAALVSGDQEGLIHGIFLGWVKNTSIKDVELKDMDGNGMFLRGWTEYQSAMVHDVRNIYAHDNALSGMQLSNAARLINSSQLLAVSNGRDGIVIDVSEAQWDNLKAVANGRTGIYVRNVHNDMFNNFDAYNNGLHGIHIVAAISCNGSNWKACWNGRAGVGTGNDVHFDDAGRPTWGYGVTTQMLVDGIVAGPLKSDNDDSSMKFSDGSLIATATEQYAVNVKTGITGSLALLNVKIPAAGLAGRMSAPKSTSLLIHELPGTTKDFQMTNGNLMIPDAVCTTAAAPAGPMRFGDYRVWVDESGKMRIKSSAPANSTDGTVIGSQA